MIPALASFIPTIIEKGMDMFDKNLKQNRRL